MAINPIETTDAISHRRYFPLNIGTIAECIQKRMVKMTKIQNQQFMLDSCISKPQSSRHTTTRLHKSKINDVTHTQFLFTLGVFGKQCLSNGFFALCLPFLCHSVIFGW